MEGRCHLKKTVVLKTVTVNRSCAVPVPPSSTDFAVLKKLENLFVSTKNRCPFILKTSGSTPGIKRVLKTAVVSIINRRYTLFDEQPD